MNKLSEFTGNETVIEIESKYSITRKNKENEDEVRTNRQTFRIYIFIFFILIIVFIALKEQLITKGTIKEVSLDEMVGIAKKTI